MSDEKVVCEHPNPEKQGVRIDRWKYDLISSAILESLPGREPGLLFQELPGEVKRLVRAGRLEQLGSLNWYVTTVKLDLEAKRLIRRVDQESPQRLIRA